MTLLRLGGVFPFLSTVLALVVLQIFQGGRTQLAICVAVFAIIGQAMVWTGLFRLTKTVNGWADGAGFHLWMGGIFSAQTLFLTGVPAVMPIPLAAPLVATLARWRMHRVGKRSGGEG